MHLCDEDERLVVDELQHGKGAHVSGVGVGVVVFGCVCGRAHIHTRTYKINTYIIYTRKRDARAGIFCSWLMSMLSEVYLFYFYFYFFTTFYTPGNVMPGDILLVVDGHPVGSFGDEYQVHVSNTLATH